jgi:UDP-3-O-[3-hydroxymyristoyl] N-acetylglucosamine deacetylase
MVLKGKTLRDSVTFEGVGIHTGEISKITVHPSPRRGIFFYKNGIEIPALHPFVVNSLASTDLGKDGVVIKTVEHLMASFYLLGIDSAVVEFHRGSEVPITDGSAKVFCEEFKRVGFEELEHYQTVFVIEEEFEIRPNGNFVRVRPYAGERFVYEGDFPYIGRKRVEYIGSPDEALVGARTFCRVEDVPLLWLNSLGKGGNPINTLPLSSDLRYLVYSGEPAYHKLLDLIGDIALLGGRVIGEIYSFRGNHRLNHQLREFLVKNGKRKELTFAAAIL